MKWKWIAFSQHTCHYLTNTGGSSLVEGADFVEGFTGLSCEIWFWSPNKSESPHQHVWTQTHWLTCWKLFRKHWSSLALQFSCYMQTICRKPAPASSARLQKLQARTLRFRRRLRDTCSCGWTPSRGSVCVCSVETEQSPTAAASGWTRLLAAAAGHRWGCVIIIGPPLKDCDEGPVLAQTMGLRL